MPGDSEGGKTYRGREWVLRETHGVGREFDRGRQKKNKEIRKAEAERKALRKKKFKMKMALKNKTGRETKVKLKNTCGRTQSRRINKRKT